jgi:hypothetical protein
VKYVHKVELNQIYAEFFGDEKDYYLYKCHVMDMKVNEIDFMQKLGLFSNEAFIKEEVDLKSKVFNRNLAVKKINL